MFCCGCLLLPPPHISSYLWHNPMEIHTLWCSCAKTASTVSSTKIEVVGGSSWGRRHLSPSYRISPSCCRSSHCCCSLLSPTPLNPSYLHCTLLCASTSLWKAHLLWQALVFEWRQYFCWHHEPLHCCNMPYSTCAHFASVGLVRIELPVGGTRKKKQIIFFFLWCHFIYPVCPDPANVFKSEGGTGQWGPS